MITIHLHDLKFYAFHGVHEEESILGGEYEVNVDVQFHEEKEKIDSLDDTVNYAEIFEIIKQRMQTPTPLLETVAMDIGKAISQKYNTVRLINISVKKLHPPIGGIQGSVGVTWHKEF